MKIKKKHLLFGVIGGCIILIALILFLLSALNTPLLYQNVNSSRPILGDLNAKVKVVEFSDIQCPACKAASTYPQRLINDFGNSISVEFKHFPLTFHQYAYKAAVGAECANDEGKFWEFLDIAYKNQQNLKLADLKSYAKQIGLNTTSFNACIESNAKNEVIDGFIREGYALDIPGTPTFFINGKISESIRYEDIKSLIEEELKK